MHCPLHFECILHFYFIRNQWCALTLGRMRTRLTRFDSGICVQLSSTNPRSNLQISTACRLRRVLQAMVQGRESQGSPRVRLLISGGKPFIPCQNTELEIMRIQKCKIKKLNKRKKEFTWPAPCDVSFLGENLLCLNRKVEKGIFADQGWPRVEISSSDSRHGSWASCRQ